MLVEFSVKNFKSFKDKVTFSMEAATGTENEENIISTPNINERILKSTAIYGANASGKTNLMNAFTAAILMIRKSNNRQVGEKLMEMEPFEFDEKTKLEPCEFEFVFYVKGIKYIYGFIADKEKVYEEYLYQYFTAKPTRIFERTNVNEYKFLQADEVKLNTIKTQNIENKLFLATATTWNYDKTKDPYLWFANNIDTYTGGISLNDFAIESYSKDDNEKLKNFTLKLLNEADIVIKNFSVEMEERDVDSNMLMIFKQLNLSTALTPQKQKDVKIRMTHEITNENGDKNNYELNLIYESSGTQILFSFAPILKDVFENGKILVIDEIERSLHPNLVEMIIKFFHNPQINKGNAQLIFNTHDTNLLSLDIFRRDQIWFAEKDPKKGATDLYPLDDFSVRKNENIQKGYLNGRYGAIPFVAMGNSLWED